MQCLRRLTRSHISARLCSAQIEVARADQVRTATIHEVTKRTGEGETDGSRGEKTSSTDTVRDNPSLSGAVPTAGYVLDVVWR